MNRKKWAVIIGYTLLGITVHLFWRLPDLWILYQIRLPRCLVSLLSGMILGGVGTLYQALFRNPLADPYTLGISSSAALGGTLVILLGYDVYFQGIGITLGAVITSLFSIPFLFPFISQTFFLQTRWILSGILLSSFLNALTSFLMIHSDIEANRIFRWLVGSTTPAFWNQVILLIMAIGIAYLPLKKILKNLNLIYLLGEEAIPLGVNLPQTVRTTFLWTSFLTALVIGGVGILGFIGLVSPHIARVVAGTDLRKHFPVSLFIGGNLLLFSDWFSLALMPTAEIPVGIITSLFGAPFIVYGIRKKWWTV